MELKRERIAHLWAWAAQCLLGSLALTITTFACFRLGVGLATVALAYVVLITLVSLLGSFSASAILSIAAAACMNYFFTQPLFEFRIDYPQDVLAVVAFATTSLIITALTTKVRKSAEAAQVAQQALIDTIPALIWTALPDGSRDFHNRRWFEFTGLSTTEAAGDGWAAALHPEDRTTVIEKWRSAVATGKLLEVEARVFSATGEYRAVLVRAAPLRDDKGAIVKWYGMSSDIEDHRRATEALRARDEQLARVSRVTTLGALTAAIAHEVNQPITAAVTNAEAALRWLCAESPALNEVQQALNRIIENGGRASDIIGRIGALIKKAPPRKGRFDLNEAIGEVLALTRSEVLRHGISLRTRFATGLPAVNGDRVQLQQVILNFILNAVEAMSGIDEGARELQISTGRDASRDVLVAVRDWGPGLDPTSVDRLFEAFYTTKPGGVGLGLAICRSIIEAHGGRLWASANEPRGAVFQFTLPAERDNIVPVQHPRPNVGDMR